MKTTNFQSSLRGTKQSILNFQLILLMFVVACHSPHNNDKLPVETAIIADSLFVPTGNVKLDSLLQLASIAKQDTALARLYDQIGDMYENNDHEKGKEYYLKSKILSEQLDWDEGRLLFASSFSVMLCREGLADSALVFVIPALEWAKRENNEAWMAILYMNTGMVYQTKDWYETALRYYMEAMPIFERIKETERLGFIYRCIGNIYHQINLPEKALEYCEKALVLLENHPDYAVYALLEVASSYNVLQQYEKSNDYYKQALELCVQQNNLYLMEGIIIHLANNALLVFDLGTAEMYANRMVEIFGSKKDIYSDYVYLLLLGKLEQLKGHFTKSEKFVLQVLDIAIEYDQPELKKLCYKLLSELSVALHKYHDHIQYYKELEKVEVAIANEATQRASAEMEAKYETAKKELEIERQQLIISKQNIQR